MMAQKMVKSKTHQRVTVRPVDIHAGIYAALSTDGISWYRVDVRAQTCSCPSGQYGFRNTRVHGGMCRHVVAARTWARALASMTPADRERALHLQNVRVNVDAIDIPALDAPLAQKVQAPPRYHDASGLLEAFGM